MVVAFDTHAAVKDLKEVGFNENQAEVMVATVGKAVNQSFATKADLTDAKAELKTDIADVRNELADAKAELKADIADVRNELAETKAELKADIAYVRNELADTRAELKADIADVRSELKADIGNLRGEIGATRAELEGRILRSTLYLVMAFVAALGVSTAFLALFLQ